MWGISQKFYEEANEMIHHCFVTGCENLATHHDPCGSCPEGHWSCESCIQKVMKQQQSPFSKKISEDMK